MTKTNPLNVLFLLRFLGIALPLAVAVLLTQQPKALEYPNFLIAAFTVSGMLGIISFIYTSYLLDIRKEQKEDVDELYDKNAEANKSLTNVHEALSRVIKATAPLSQRIPVLQVLIVDKGFTKFADSYEALNEALATRHPAMFQDRLNLDAAGKPIVQAPVTPPPGFRPGDMPWEELHARVEELENCLRIVQQERDYDRSTHDAYREVSGGQIAALQELNLMYRHLHRPKGKGLILLRKRTV